MPGKVSTAEQNPARGNCFFIHQVSFPTKIYSYRIVLEQQYKKGSALVGRSSVEHPTLVKAQV